jgi:hypothetical protein
MPKLILTSHYVRFTCTMGIPMLELNLTLCQNRTQPYARIDFVPSVRDLGFGLWENANNLSKALRCLICSETYSLGTKSGCLID